MRTAAPGDSSDKDRRRSPAARHSEKGDPDGMLDDAFLVTDDFDAIRSLLGEWQSQWPDMGLLALLPETEKSRLDGLQADCRAQGVALIGAIFPALVTEAGFVGRGAWLLRFNRMPPWFLVHAEQRLESGPIATAVKEVLLKAPPTQGRHTLFLIFDGMVPNIGTILNGLHQALAHQFSYIGGNAGSETFLSTPCLFDDRRVVANGVIGLLLTEQVDTVVHHGYSVSQPLMRATSTDGNRITLIDGRPAFEVYREIIQAEYQVSVNHENFYDYAAHFPFGLVTMIDVLVRIPVGFDDDGSVICVGEVPPDSMLRLLRAPILEDSTCVDAIAQTLGAAPDSRLSSPILTLYCAGRRKHFDTDAALEIGRLQALTGAPRIAGALSLGEIDSVAAGLDLPRFHNAAIVCIR